MTSLKEFHGDVTTLCQIFVIFRHGDRAPMFIWPSDPRKSDWPNGVGSLTNKGKEQAFMIGKLLRKMHPGFLNDKYLKGEIHVHSTNTSRTIMSALCCLAGLYPPKGDDVWLSDMPWQPIPVNTAPRESDPFAFIYDKQDLLAKIERANTAKCDEYRILSEHKEILKTITEQSIAAGHDGSLFMLSRIIDAYQVNARKDSPAYLPPGIDMDQKTSSSILHAIYSVLLSSKGAMAPSIHHLKDILSKAEKKIEGKIPTQKAFLYSTHDLILNNCFSLLKTPTVRPVYGATMVFELHKNPEDGQYYMKLMFKDNIESLEDPKTVPINGSTVMPFSEFQELVSGLKVEEEE